MDISRERKDMPILKNKTKNFHISAQPIIMIDSTPPIKEIKKEKKSVSLYGLIKNKGTWNDYTFTFQENKKNKKGKREVIYFWGFVDNFKNFLEKSPSIIEYRDVAAIYQEKFDDDFKVSKMTAIGGLKIRVDSSDDILLLFYQDFREFDEYKILSFYIKDNKTILFGDVLIAKNNTFTPIDNNLFMENGLDMTANKMIIFYSWFNKEIKKYIKK